MGPQPTNPSLGMTTTKTVRSVFLWHASKGPIVLSDFSKRDIAAANFVMHEVHCRRNIVLCEKCGEPVPRTEMEEHIAEEHALVPCEMCSLQFEISKIEAHKVGTSFGNYFVSLRRMTPKSWLSQLYLLYRGFSIRKTVIFSGKIGERFGFRPSFFNFPESQ